MRLIREGGMEVGWRGRLYIYIYLSLHRNDFCIKAGSDQNHLNVSLIVRDKVTRQCPQSTTFEEKGEPKHHQNDSCIKMGSDESHFNVSVGNDGHSHKTVSTDHNF